MSTTGAAKRAPPPRMEAMRDKWLDFSINKEKRPIAVKITLKVIPLKMY
jgi:hypothetical protein